MGSSGIASEMKYQLSIRRKNGDANGLVWRLFEAETKNLIASSDDHDSIDVGDFLIKTATLDDGVMVIGVVSSPDRDFRESDFYKINDLCLFAEDYKRLKDELNWGRCVLSIHA